MKKYLAFIVMVIITIAINGCTSNKSNPVQPAQPTFAVNNLVATRTDSTTVRLTWNAVGGADTLMVHRGVNGRFPDNMIAQIAPTRTQYIDSGLYKDSTYTYQVVAEHGQDVTSSSVVTAPLFHAVTITYAASVRPILNICTNCHNTSLNSGGWTVDGLTQAVNNHTLNSFHGLGGTIVVPGNAAGSEMYQRITASPSSGIMMPQGGPALSASQIATIHDWIQSGANP